MKRFLCCVLFLSTLFSATAYAVTPLRDGDISIAAPSALLMEKETGEVLYEKNAHEHMLPASVTKIMTLLLLMEDIEAGKISTEDTVTASARAASFGGSNVYLEEGEQMSVHEMLKCIAVVSANDCAVAMAEFVSGTEELFVDRMNKRAAELGMADTHFTSCTGLFDDASHYTSAYDVALMSRELLKHDKIKEYTTIWMDSIRNGGFGLSSTNKLVYWYDGCTGLKTGFTSAAMYCISATAERDGVEYIAVIMHSQSSDSRNDDAMTLLNYAFANYGLCSLRPEEPLPSLPVEMGAEETAPLRFEGGETALVNKTSAQPEYSLSLPEKLRAPIEEGQQVGTLTVTLAGQTVAEVPVCAAQAVPRLSFFGILGLLAGSLLGL